MSEEINIGSKVQEFRKKNGMSLRELAASAEMSASMLSQIENNAVNPSINTLKNIAEALQIPLFQFFKSDPETDTLIVRKGENRIVGRMDEDVQYKLLTPDISGTIEFCLMEIPTGITTSDVPREHNGEEVAHVIGGEVDLLLNGSVYHLFEGDSVRIPPMSPHRWSNRGEHEARVVFAVNPPCF